MITFFSHFAPRNKVKFMNSKINSKKLLEQSDLVITIQSFSKVEFKEFMKFVRSPFFNTKKDMIRLIEELKKHYPLFNKTSFTRENLYSKVYPYGKFKDNVMRRMTSNLNKLTKDFLSYKSFKEDQFQFRFSYLNSLFKRNINNIIPKEIKKCDDLLNNVSRIQSSDLINKYFFNDLKYLYKMQRKKNKTILNEPEGLNTIIYYFINELYANLFEILSETHVFNRKINNELLAIFMKNFNEKSFFIDFEKIKHIDQKNKILVLISYYTYYGLVNLKDNKFHKYFLKYLNINSSMLNDNTIRDHYFRLLNIYHLKKRAGFSESYNKEIFEIYVQLLCKNMLFSPNTLHLNHFQLINVILLAVKLKKFTWAEKLLEENIGKVIPVEKNNTYNYCKALLAYEMKDVKSALACISKVKFDTRRYRAKILICKIYYDMNYFEELLSFIDSFRHYLKNDKNIPNDLKTENVKFLKTLNKLVLLKFKNNIIGLSELKKEIKVNNHKEKEWFITKIDEIIKN